VGKEGAEEKSEEGGGVEREELESREKKERKNKEIEKKRKEKNEQTKEKAPLFKIYSVLRFDRGLDNHSYSYLVSISGK
jgi:hypothetical protein